MASGARPCPCKRCRRVAQAPGAHLVDRGGDRAALLRAQLPQQRLGFAVAPRSDVDARQLHRGVGLLRVERARLLRLRFGVGELARFPGLPRLAQQQPVARGIPEALPLRTGRRFERAGTIEERDRLGVPPLPHPHEAQAADRLSVPGLERERFLQPGLGLVEAVGLDRGPSGDARARRGIGRRRRAAGLALRDRLRDHLEPLLHRGLAGVGLDVLAQHRQALGHRVHRDHRPAPRFLRLARDQHRGIRAQLAQRLQRLRAHGLPRAHVARERHLVARVVGMASRELGQRRARRLPALARPALHLRDLERQLVVGRALGEDRAKRDQRLVVAARARELARLPEAIAIGPTDAKERAEMRDTGVLRVRVAQALERGRGLALLVRAKLQATEREQRLGLVGPQAQRLVDLPARAVVAAARLPELGTLEQRRDLRIRSGLEVGGEREGRGGKQQRGEGLPHHRLPRARHCETRQCVNQAPPASRMPARITNAPSGTGLSCSQ
jgi:hypothetical protein